MVGAAPIDRYVVLEHLSEGGMGAIYVGKKLGAGGFEMEVVLKQLLPEFTQQEEFIDLFLREAKLSATLDHANIVHTIDLVTAGGEYFIVMEYLPGGDLRTLLKRAKRRGKRFTPAAAIRICRETLSALSYAHVKRDFSGQPLKLIHRDVSPSNILVSYTGEVKLTDFGIAKAATHNSLFYKVKGKIGYMSPEQARSEPLDHRSDLYSLAVCLFEVITGERLFVHAGLTTSADEIYSQPVPKLSRKVPNIPPELEAIMDKALSIDADKRFQTAGEFNEALTRCAHRNQLLMSAPELAQELLVACGETSQWRNEDEDDDDELGYAQRPGTEVYDIADDEDEDDVGPMSIHALAAKIGKPRKGSGAEKPADKLDRPKTEVGRFQGVELTSIINMIDLEGPDGAKPLVDLLDSGPQRSPLLDSGPRPLASLESGPRQIPIPPTTAMRPNRLPPSSVPPEDMLPTAPRPFVPRPPGQPSMGPGMMQPPQQQTMQGLPPMHTIQQQMQGHPTGNPMHRHPGPPQPQHPYPQQQHYPQQPSYPSQPGRPQQMTQMTRARGTTAKGKRSSVRTWLVVVLILIAAGFATFFIATSGPDVAVRGK